MVRGMIVQFLEQHIGNNLADEAWVLCGFIFVGEGMSITIIDRRATFTC